MELPGSVWTIVGELHRAAQLERRAVARAPLAPVPLAVLGLATRAPVTPKAAAAALDVPGQSITRAVGELVAAGLVDRVGDRSDARSYAIAATEAGRAERDRLCAELAARLARQLTGWSEPELAVFAEQLTRLVSALAADGS